MHRSPIARLLHVQMCMCRRYCEELCRHRCIHVCMSAICAQSQCQRAKKKNEKQDLLLVGAWLVCFFLFPELWCKTERQRSPLEKIKINKKSSWCRTRGKNSSVVSQVSASAKLPNWFKNLQLFKREIFLKEVDKNEHFFSTLDWLKKQTSLDLRIPRTLWSPFVFWVVYSYYETRLCLLLTEGTTCQGNKSPSGQKAQSLRLSMRLSNTFPSIKQ